MKKVKVAATQMKSCGFNRVDNIEKAEKLVREAAAKGAQIILIQELFQTDYFCQKMLDGNFKLALQKRGRSSTKAFSEISEGIRCRAAH